MVQIWMKCLAELIKNKKYCQEVNEVVYRIKENTRHSHILFEFNCIYGFYRNLLGGLLLDL